MVRPGRARPKRPTAATTSPPDLVVERLAPGDANPAEQFLTARDAAQLLRVKPQTLYAYVSRGWLHSMGHDKRRGYLYSRDDVERLRARGRAKADGGPYKSGAPRWSEPIVQTAITAISPTGPRYRGHAALDLVRRSVSFESVAELLWSGVWSEDPPPWTVHRSSVALDHLVELVSLDVERPDIVKLFSLLVLSIAVQGSGGDDLRDGNTVVGARKLIALMPGCMGFLSKAQRYVELPAVADRTDDPLARRILVSAGVPAGPDATRALNAALVLLADHELTPQTVAARLAASSGASLYYCVLSALSAHSGSRIRRACDRVEDILTTTPTTRELGERLAALEGRSRAVPGFSHPLYPDGDPRAACLLELARELDDRGAQRDGLCARLATVANDLAVLPGVETGLVALCHVLKLPYRSAGAILVMSRCAGWIAHVIEQRLAGMMLRPRARYQP